MPPMMKWNNSIWDNCIRTNWENGNGHKMILEELKKIPDFPKFCNTTKLKGRMKVLGCVPVSGKGSNDSHSFKSTKINKRKLLQNSDSLSEPPVKRFKINDLNELGIFVINNEIKECVQLMIPKGDGIKLNGSNESPVLRVIKKFKRIKKADFNETFGERKTLPESTQNKRFGCSTEKLFLMNSYECYDDIPKKQKTEEMKFILSKEKRFDYVVPCAVDQKEGLTSTEGDKYFGFTMTKVDPKQEVNAIRKNTFESKSSDEEDED